MFISRVKKEEKTRKITLRARDVPVLSRHPAQAAATASAVSVVSQRIEVWWWLLWWSMDVSGWPFIVVIVIDSEIQLLNSNNELVRNNYRMPLAQGQDPKCNVPGVTAYSTVTDPAISPFRIRTSSINRTCNNIC